MNLLLIILSVITILNNVEAGKILFYIPLSTKSVKITFTPVLDALAERGHEVTVAMPFEVFLDVSSWPNLKYYLC